MSSSQDYTLHYKPSLSFFFWNRKHAALSRVYERNVVTAGIVAISMTDLLETHHEKIKPVIDDLMGLVCSEVRLP
jgi:hypothetical protein